MPAGGIESSSPNPSESNHLSLTNASPDQDVSLVPNQKAVSLSANAPKAPSLWELRRQATQAFAENRFAEAEQVYERILKEQDSLSTPLRASFLENRARCQYAQGKFTEAIQTLKEILHPDQESIQRWLLLGRIEYDQDHLEASRDALERALTISQEYEEASPVWTELSYVYEEMSVRALLAGEISRSRSLLEKAIQPIEAARAALGREFSYSTPARHRLGALKAMLAKHPQMGSVLPKSLPQFSRKDLFDLAGRHLKNEQLAILKYPFESTGAMRQWSDQHLSHLSSNILKVRRLYRLFRSEAGLCVRENYDQLVVTNKTGYWLGRTAQEVFEETYIGDADMGYESDRKVRYGDCESANNLFIALARAAGLNAFMVRTFVDVDQGYIGEHRVIGVEIEAGRFVLVDLTWYQSVDSPYASYRILNDQENFAYYLHGYNQLNDKARPFLECALQFCPDNELLLVDLASLENDKKNYAKALEYLARVPETAKGLPDYWKLRSNIELQQNRWEEAMAVLQESKKHLHHAPELLTAEGDLLESRERYEEAVGRYREAIKIYPLRQGVTWRKIGKLERQLGHFQASLEAYEESFDAPGKKQEDQPLGDQGIADTHLAMMDWGQALEYYARALERKGEVSETIIEILVRKILKTPSKFQQAIQTSLDQIAARADNKDDAQNILRCFERTYRRHPDVLEINLKLVRLYAQQGKMAPSLNAAVKAMQHSDFLPGELPKFLEMYEKLGTSTQALEMFSHHLAARDDPAAAELWGQAGLFQLNLQRYEPAIIYYRKSEELARRHNLTNQLGACYNDVGLCLWNMGKLSEAEDSFRQALMSDPKRELFLRNLLNLHVAQKQWDKAKSISDQLLSLETVAQDSVAAILRNGQARGKLAEGLSQTEIALAAKPAEKQRQLWFCMGSFAAENGRTNRAIDYYQREIHSWPEDSKEETLANTYNNLALLYSGLGETTNAERHYRRAMEICSTNELYVRNLLNFCRDLKLWEKANPLANQMLTLETATASSVRAFLKNWQSQDKVEEGLKRAEAVIAAKPVEKQRRLWFSIGYFAAELSLTNQAVDCYQKEIQVWPENSNVEIVANAHNNLALLYKERSKTSLAESHFLKALQIAPKDELCARNLANLYRDCEQWEKANRQYDGVLALDSLSEESIAAFVENWERQKELKKGLERIEAAISKKSSERQRQLWFWAGNALSVRNHHQGAAECYLRELALWPSQAKEAYLAQVHSRVASEFVILKNWDSAESHYQKAIEIRPEEESDRISLAGIYRQIRRWDRAIECYQGLLTWEKLSDWSIVHGILESYAELGQLTNGVAVCRKANAFKTNPSFLLELLSDELKSRGDWQAARGFLREIADRDGWPVGIVEKLFYLTLDPKERRDLVDQLRQRYPQATITHELFSIWLISKGDYENALVEMRLAQKPRPQWHHLFYEMILLHLLDRPEEARQLVEKCRNQTATPNGTNYTLADGGSLTEGNGTLEMIQMQDSYMQREYAAAIQFGKRAVQSGSLYPAAWLLYAQALIAGEKPDEADQVLQQACKQGNQARNLNPDLLLLRAQIRLLAKDWDQAGQLLGEYEGKFGRSPDSRAIRCCLAAAQNHTEEFTAAYEELKSLVPVTEKHLLQWITLPPRLVTQFLKAAQSLEGEK